MKHYSIDEVIDFQESSTPPPSEFNEHLYECEQCRDNWNQLKTYKKIWEAPIEQSQIHTELWQSIAKEINKPQQNLPKAVVMKKKRPRVLLTSFNFMIAVAAGVLLFFNMEVILKLVETKDYVTSFNTITMTATKESLNWLNLKINEFNFNSIR